MKSAETPHPKFGPGDEALAALARLPGDHAFLAGLITSLAARGA